METKRSTRTRKVDESHRKKISKEKKAKKKPKKPLVDKKREYEENNYSLEKKIRRLAKWMEDADTTLVYTGAGISTAANIPDYRGPNGVWTLAQQGKEIIRCGNITTTEPTTSHMILKELHQQRYVTHILSQNCDGLHLRSGIPQTALSEIHGNMNIEVCAKCERQHIRSYDVTAKSALQKHETGRFCDSCNGELEDTIVHFGECGRVRWPLNWDGTRRYLHKADLIICVGTSLAVLKAYGELWPERDQNTKVVIVNLQWTVKDKEADMKIHSKCDNFFEKLAYYLDIQPDPYCRNCDPVLNHVPLRERYDKKRRNDVIRKISTCVCDGSHRQGELTLVTPSVSINDGEEASTSGEMPGWWAYGLKMQMNTGKKKGKVGRSKKVPPRKDKSSEAQMIEQVLNEIIDQLDPIPRGKSTKEEVKSEEVTNSDNSEREEEDEEKEMEMNRRRKRGNVLKDHRVKTPELISRLGIEAGALLEDTHSNVSDSDDDYTITKQQMGSDRPRAACRATRRSSNTQTNPPLMDGLPPRKNKSRSFHRKRREIKKEVDNEEEEEEIVKKSRLDLFKKENSIEFTSTSVSTPSIEDSQINESPSEMIINPNQGKGSPCSSISEELGTMTERGSKVQLEEEQIEIKPSTSSNYEPKVEMTVREYISSQASTLGGLNALKMDSSAKSKLSQLIQEVKMKMDRKELEQRGANDKCTDQKPIPILANPGLSKSQAPSDLPIHLQSMSVLSSQMSVGEVLKMLKGGLPKPRSNSGKSHHKTQSSNHQQMKQLHSHQVHQPILPPQKVIVAPIVTQVIVPNQEPSLRREANESLDDFLARTLPPEYYRQIERIETPRDDLYSFSDFGRDQSGVFTEMVQLAEEAYLLASRIKVERPENSENQSPKPRKPSAQAGPKQKLPPAIR